ncbi:MAG: hypothetical protein HY314_15175 [Acidobacteria bacterium]|nr:hypothetical protein [Acidobacteriota bacterium]
MRSLTAALTPEYIERVPVISETARLKKLGPADVEDSDQDRMSIEERLKDSGIYVTEA